MPSFNSLRSYNLTPLFSNKIVRLTSDDLPKGSGPIRHPQPIILDSKLRFPTTAKLLLPKSPTKPWIFTSPIHSDSQKKANLEALGAKVFFLDLDPSGTQSDLHLLNLQVYVQVSDSEMVLTDIFTYGGSFSC